MPQVSQIVLNNGQPLATQDYAIGLDQLYGRAEAVRKQRNANQRMANIVKQTMLNQGLGGDVNVSDEGSLQAKATDETLKRYFGVAPDGTLNAGQTTDQALMGLEQQRNDFYQAPTVKTTTIDNTGKAAATADALVNAANTPQTVAAYNKVAQNIQNSPILGPSTGVVQKADPGTILDQLLNKKFGVVNPAVANPNVDPNANPPYVLPEENRKAAAASAADGYAEAAGIKAAENNEDPKAAADAARANAPDMPPEASTSGMPAHMQDKLIRQEEAAKAYADAMAKKAGHTDPNSQEYIKAWRTANSAALSDPSLASAYMQAPAGTDLTATADTNAATNAANTKSAKVKSGEKKNIEQDAELAYVNKLNVKNGLITESTAGGVHNDPVGYSMRSLLSNQNMFAAFAAGGNSPVGEQMNPYDQLVRAKIQGVNDLNKTQNEAMKTTVTGDAGGMEIGLDKLKLGYKEGYGQNQEIKVINNAPAAPRGANPSPTNSKWTIAGGSVDYDPNKPSVATMRDNATGNLLNLKTNSLESFYASIEGIKKNENLGDKAAMYKAFKERIDKSSWSDPESMDSKASNKEQYENGTRQISLSYGNGENYNYNLQPDGSLSPVGNSPIIGTLKGKFPKSIKAGANGIYNIQFIPDGGDFNVKSGTKVSPNWLLGISAQTINLAELDNKSQQGGS